MEDRFTWNWAASDHGGVPYGHGDGKMILHGQLVPIADLTDLQRDQMFALMEAHYEHMDRKCFEVDLREKQWVILLRNNLDNSIGGFSTQMLLNVTIDEQPIRILFSGDTIVGREYWARNPLAQVWGRLALTLIDSAPSTPLHWFLLTKGYKTYRFLPVFFHEFYPRHDFPTPAWAAQLIDTLGRHKYPHAYDTNAGIVRADGSSYRLRAGIAEITKRQCKDPHIRFFAQKNSGHIHGDELCCLAPLTRDNFTAAAYRVIGSAPVLSEEH